MAHNLFGYPPARERRGEQQVGGKAIVQTRLTEYEAQAWEALRARALGRALAIASHILEHHPRALGAHLLAGEALRSSGHVDIARDFLLRALSADPEALPAYAGLSRLAAAERDMEEANWYAERAFELTPWNPRGREWLRRMHARRDGIEYRRIYLTRAALTRLWVASGSLWRARLELESLLRHLPQRLDLQVTLIEVLWRLEEHASMAIRCERVLEVLPHCWKANLLLGLHRQQEGHRREATRCLVQAQDVDPDGTRASQLLAPEGPPPWQPASVPPWDGANLPVWAEAVAQLQERTPPLSSEEVVWVREGDRQ